VAVAAWGEKLGNTRPPIQSGLDYRRCRAVAFDALEWASNGLRLSGNPRSQYGSHHHWYAGAVDRSKRVLGRTSGTYRTESDAKPAFGGTKPAKQRLDKLLREHLGGRLPLNPPRVSVLADLRVIMDLDRVGVSLAEVGG